MGIFVAVAILLLVRLGRPHTFVFDEIYYANDALDLITEGTERTFAAHPPLGKWLMAPGIEALGFTPVGWRIDSVLFGAGSAVLTYLLACRFTGSRLLGGLAVVLLVTDGIFFTSSRLAMLDVFLCFFCLLLLWLLTIPPPRRAWHPVVCGVVLGLAMAVKWSALLLVAAVPLVVALQAPGLGLRRRIGRAAAVVGCAAAVYVASYSGWLVGGGPFGNCAPAGCPTTFAGRLAELPSVQQSMVDFQTDLTRHNPYLAGGWSWLIQDRPTVLFQEGCRGQSDAACAAHQRGTVRIEGRGSFLLWWPAVATIPAAAVLLAMRWRRRRRLRSQPEELAREAPGTTGRAPLDTNLGVLLAFVLALYAPWAFNRDTYTFYATSLVPLLAVVTAWWLGYLVRRTSHRLLGAALPGVAAVTLFAFQWPSLVALS